MGNRGTGTGIARSLKGADGERSFVLCLIAGFLAIRLIWLIKVHGGIDGFLDASEATRVALSVARHGVIGDAYLIGQGPTAHLMPLNPLLAGGVMWLFGPGSTAANLTLLALSLGQVICGYLLVRQVFVRLGADPRALRWGTALLMLLAPFVPQETVDFRYWEGASALCLVALNMLAMIALDKRRRLSGRELLLIPALFALTAFVSPPAGLAVALGWAVVALRALPLASAATLAVATAMALAALFVPWTLRNASVLGEPIPLRSNAGIELALAMHPAAVSGDNPAQVFHDRLGEVHPAANAAALQIVRRDGEAAYSRKLARQSWAWIRENPAAAARLWLRHVSEVIVPRPWQMYFTGWEGARVARATIIAIVQLIGLAGLAIALWTRHRRYWIVASYIAVTALAFGFFQPMPRYGFLLYPFFAFLAAQALAALRRPS